MSAPNPFAAVAFLLPVVGALVVVAWIVRRALWVLTSPDACWGSCL